VLIAQIADLMPSDAIVAPFGSGFILLIMANPGQFLSFYDVQNPGLPVN